MNKILIPTILTATILIAGMFAMMPVQKASSVHTTIQANTANIIELTATINPFAAATDTATWTIGAPFCVVSAARTGGVDANANLDVAAFALSTNHATAAEVALAVNDGLGAASIAARNLLITEATGVVETPICGTTTVALGNTAIAGDAADTNVLSVLVEVRGSVVAPAAVLS